MLIKSQGSRKVYPHPDQKQQATAEEKAAARPLTPQDADASTDGSWPMPSGRAIGLSAPAPRGLAPLPILAARPACSPGDRPTALMLGQR